MTTRVSGLDSVQEGFVSHLNNGHWPTIRARGRGMGPGGKGCWDRSFMNMEEGDPASWRRAVPSYRQMSLAEIHFDTHGDTRHTKEKGKNNWSPTLQNSWS